ncbi:MAG: TetR/AcrR family transcriptional regulator [Actinomycetota bacterium]|nr:TetR/AcrR family transcriptional regulator [Actinomycetota bacterium]
MLSAVPRRSAADVADSRSSAVEAAIDLASVEGLEGITIGRLAAELGMSKSGLIGRFGDKQTLQRAVLAAAVERFTDAVYRPARRFEPGLPRLAAIIDAWIGHLREDVFPGGCFVTTASVEYDSRPGPLREDVAQAVRRWLGVLEAEAGRARGRRPAQGPRPRRRGLRAAQPGLGRRRGRPADRGRRRAGPDPRRDAPRDRTAARPSAMTSRGALTRA